MSDRPHRPRRAISGRRAPLRPPRSTPARRTPALVTHPEQSRSSWTFWPRPASQAARKRRGGRTPFEGNAMWECKSRAHALVITALLASAARASAEPPRLDLVWVDPTGIATGTFEAVARSEERRVGKECS